MKLSDTPLEQREGHIAYINKRWSQLSDLELSWGGEPIKYLLLVNSGAAAAILTFLGTSQQVRALLWPKVMLAAFMLGVVFVGLYQAVRYHRIAHIYKCWRKGVSHYYSDNTGWREMISDDEGRSTAWLTFQISLAYIAFACFLLGVAVGLCNFMDLK
jgi:hypothetical protein